MAYVSQRQETSLWNDSTYSLVLIKMLLRSYTIPKGEFGQAIALMQRQIRSFDVSLDDLERLHALMIPLQRQTRWPLTPPVNPQQRALSRVNELSSIMTDPQAPVAVGTNGYLDFGCGDGSITAAVGSALGLVPQRIVGIDLFPQSSVDPNMLYIQAPSNGYIPLNRNIIDFTTAFVALHHVPNAERTIAEFQRISRPDAIVIIREHDVDPIADPTTARFLNLIHAMMMLNGVGEFTLQASDWTSQRQEIVAYMSSIRYRSRSQWDAAFNSAQFQAINYRTYDPQIPNPQRLYYAVYRLTT
jgi:ubiquinone/menaquinone biosynthesis C-methylase UbiE